jgi:hypothetical protein
VQDGAGNGAEETDRLGEEISKHLSGGKIASLAALKHQASMLDNETEHHGTYFCF